MFICVHLWPLFPPGGPREPCKRLVPGFLSRYCLVMADAKNEDINQSVPILDEEDEATLAAIDRGIQSADARRVVSLEDVRQRMNGWLTKSSSPKTR